MTTVFYLNEKTTKRSSKMRAKRSESEKYIFNRHREGENYFLKRRRNHWMSDFLDLKKMLSFSKFIINTEIKNLDCSQQVYLIKDGCLSLQSNNPLRIIFFLRYNLKTPTRNSTATNVYPFPDGQNAHCAFNIHVTRVARVKTIPLHPVQEGIGRGRPWGGVEGLE